MEIGKFISFVLLLNFVIGEGEFPPNPDVQNYAYNYFVRDETTGDVKSHEETKLGDTVSGKYTVGEPTGDLRVVTYTADEGGFRANVEYQEGGSPISDKQEMSRQQTAPVSGYQFKWLPANADEGEKAADKPTVESSEKAQEEPKGYDSYGPPPEGAAGTESVPEMPPAPIENGEKVEEEEKPEGYPAAPEEGYQAAPEGYSEASEGKMMSDETGEMKQLEGKGSDEAKDDIKEGKPQEEKEDSPAESDSKLQEASPTEQSQNYLPPYPPAQESVPPPVYGQPITQPSSNDRPTIIYASQNFYTPWQWFGPGSNGKEEPPAEHYMTGLGYVIMPPTKSHK